LLTELKERASQARQSGGALVVDTYALAGVMQHGLEAEFISLCEVCSSVVCARVSPLQKSQVVEMVRGIQPGAVTLSIGDGANDVPMLKVI
ncbi:unnamed protein product, partial [Choristocarpus tenellus]